MKLLDKAVQLEKALLNRFGRRSDITRHPLEVYYAILDDIEDAAEPEPRGGRIFAYNAILVTVVAPDAHARATAQALYTGPPSLEERVRARLRQAGCAGVDALTATVKFVERPQAAWPTREYHVGFRRSTARPRSTRDATTPAQRLEIHLAILSGTAAKARYNFTASRINLGRLADVLDRDHRVARQNHVAFDDGGDDVTQSVSRAHAHIAVHATTNEARLHDDGSTHGTRIVRTGRTISVPRGGRGVALRDGDEVLLGQARLRVSLRTVARAARARRVPRTSR